MAVGLRFLRPIDLFGSLFRGFGPWWRDAVHIVKPEAVIRWRRNGFQRHWARNCKKKERPGLDPKIKALIIRMSRANQLWGAPRIHGELMKLGIEVYRTTVAKYLVRGGKPPSQTWRTFLEYHTKDLTATDFFTVPTATFRIFLVLVVPSHDRREIVRADGTGFPTAEWTGRQVVEAIGLDDAPKYLIRDRDRKFSEFFSRKSLIGRSNRSSYSACLALAECLRRVRHRHDQKRMPGSHSHDEAEHLFDKFLKRYETTAPQLVDWAEEAIPEGFTVFSLPDSHRRKLRTTNLMERFNEEVRQRTRVAMLFPNKAACLHLVWAILMEVSEDWHSAGKRYVASNKECALKG